MEWKVSSDFEKCKLIFCLELWISHTIDCVANVLEWAVDWFSVSRCLGVNLWNHVGIVLKQVWGLTYGTPKNEHVYGLRVLFEHDSQNYFFEQLMQGDVFELGVLFEYESRNDLFEQLMQGNQSLESTCDDSRH